MVVSTLLGMYDIIVTKYCSIKESDNKIKFEKLGQIFTPWHRRSQGGREPCPPKFLTYLVL